MQSAARSEALAPDFDGRADDEEDDKGDVCGSRWDGLGTGNRSEM
jgi:hypothetical protein